MLNIWTQPSGYDFGTFSEQIVLNLPLPVQNNTGITYKVISGALPGGLAITGNHIVGSAYIVSARITYTFCIRASNGVDIADRTFTMSINSANQPVWVTNTGTLPAGVNKQLYVLDSTYVSYQLQAYDLNIAVGAQLTYFIGSDDGELPPGLTLSSTGLISGFVEPALVIQPGDGAGSFDETFYDKVAYDYGQLPTDGFDSYLYDGVFFDFYSPSTTPYSLNANYQFRVTVTDGLSYKQRVFKIFVIGTDQFRADSTALDGFAGGFTADSTFLRTPVWLSKSFLGTFRANNYLTVPVALYDNKNTEFRLEYTNEEVYAVTFQILNSDNQQGSNHVTVSNVKGTPAFGQYFNFEDYIQGAGGASYQISGVQSLGNSEYRLTITTTLTSTLPNGVPFYIGSLSKLPPGVNFDAGTGEIYGLVPYQPQVNQVYTFTLTAVRFNSNVNENVNSSRRFQISVLGNTSGIIVWNTNNNLGSIPANYICTINVNATSDVPNSKILYALDSGTLPPGITLSPDGELIGTPPQYGTNVLYRSLWKTGRAYHINDVVTYQGNFYICIAEHTSSTFGLIQWDPYTYSVSGLASFDSAACTFDRNTTTIDKTYKFSIQASDQYGYDQTVREFTLSITTPNTVPYSNITTRPFLTPKQRASWHAFINNTSVFTPNSVYRANDINFGLQTNLTMLVYAGIQTQEAAAYVGAMGLNHKRKQFQFGTVKSANAIDPITKQVVYEVVYVQMIDPMEPNGKRLPASIKFSSIDPETITADLSNSIWSNTLDALSNNAPTSVRPDYVITMDSTGYEASNPNTNTYFPNSISNWQDRLNGVGLSERDYLPLWMRSVQGDGKQQIGYTLCVPICFCKPGTSSTIISNIKFSGFEFNTLDYTVDRFTISAVTGYASDKYLVFKNDRITV
jgi:hypothetical protein